ncbi:hypothetical protein BDB00DRAFT_823259, partial [Zychaea mexicana]|uniref:uncharacterized protein n=1 Tax=Zychaea mexicana TaxID=64656 RepID=UPI0022FEC805
MATPMSDLADARFRFCVFYRQCFLSPNCLLLFDLFISGVLDRRGDVVLVLVLIMMLLMLLQWHCCLFPSCWLMKIPRWPPSLAMFLAKETNGVATASSYFSLETERQQHRQQRRNGTQRV